jgi:hypothetical protein
MLHAIALILAGSVFCWGVYGFIRSLWRPSHRRGHDVGEASAINGVGGGWPVEHHHSPSHDAGGGDGGSSH